MTIFGSVCLYIKGHIKYIDALFLASGAATQSGLNTVDINSLNTWQQIMIMVISVLCNPITINTFVVILRLYWFEKRFQHIAKEASRKRRSMSKTFSRSKTNERDISREERAVGNRDIIVMHNRSSHETQQVSPGCEERDPLDKSLTPNERSRSSNTSEGTDKGEGSEPSFKGNTNETETSPRQIKFADQVGDIDRQMDEGDRLPVQRRHEDHIAFLERQRNPSDHAVLRIPGPRDADAGIAPQAMDEDEADNLPPSRRGSSQASDRLYAESASVDTVETEPVRRNVTIAEPPTAAERIVVDAEAAKHTMGFLRFRKPKLFKKLTDEKTQSLRSRTNTFQTIRSVLTRDKEEGLPYLSWQPTVGRNSAFGNLTAEQREELGGIEYRSLKSLAMILTVYFWGFLVFGIVCLTPWIIKSSPYGAVVTQDGQGRPWWGIFTASSAFTDLGFTLTPDSMISFQSAIWPLLVMSFLIIAGNTGFPIVLRIIIWVTTLWVPSGSGIYEELRFLLDHPRRCFTLLFPSKATWWLFWILVILNGLDLIFFIALDVSTSPSLALHFLMAK